MFFFFALVSSLGLATNSFLRLLFQSGGFLQKLQKLIGCAAFGYASWIIYSYKVETTFKNYDPQIYLIGVILLVLIAIPKPGILTQNPFSKLLKWVLYVAVAVSLFMTLGLSYYKSFAVGKPFLVIKMTGATKQENIEKLQTTQIEKETLTQYQVVIEDLEGHPLCQQYLYGDIVGIRVKTLSFSPWCLWFGLEPCYRLDMLYNGFNQSSHYSAFPVRAISLYEDSKFLNFFETLFHKFWGEAFYGKKKFSWIRAAALQSQYFPLSSQDKPFIGSFELSLYSSGIAGKAL